MENTKRETGAIYTKNNVYRTRDTVNALKLARLLQSLNRWKQQNENSTDKSTTRHVKAIKGFL